MPTQEDVAELFKYTERTLPKPGLVDCKSIDAKHIFINVSSFFWTSEEKDATNGHTYNCYLNPDFSFKGDKINVMLVKRKK